MRVRSRVHAHHRRGTHSRQGACKKKVRGTARSSHNHNYDDERGDYKIVLRDQIASVGWHHL